MPWLIGSAPVRRTLQYLRSGLLELTPEIKIFTLNYLSKDVSSIGLKNFAFWHVPQLQYANPGVQVVVLRDLAPSPFISCLLDTQIPKAISKSSSSTKSSQNKPGSTPSVKDIKSSASASSSFVDFSSNSSREPFVPRTLQGLGGLTADQARGFFGRSGSLPPDWDWAIDPAYERIHLAGRPFDEGLPPGHDRVIEAEKKLGAGHPKMEEETVLEEVLLDCFGRSRTEILEAVQSILCPSETTRSREERRERHLRQSHFGFGCDRQCMCELVGHVPCSGGDQPMPGLMRGRSRLRWVREQKDKLDRS